MARLERFDEKYKTAMFSSVIGEDALEMDFTPETDNQVLNKVVGKFEEFYIGKQTKPTRDSSLIAGIKISM